MKYSYTDDTENSLLYDKRRRVDMTLPQGLVDDMDEYCRHIGVTRSAFVTMAVQRMLPYTYISRDD